ncbi:excalibur calcium-binding domain-containing protein [Sphingopyxis bauzanensis]|uniref:excalibur calcium-binding domain-containing protein n=1 Tax=Sphingopyxis bauzanensis TaxID=651663 RepID=UPI001E465D92|nr:excalibur calcium-binding domain-containing protein [Sphingopyxis bauzanensis]
MVKVCAAGRTAAEPCAPLPFRELLSRLQRARAAGAAPLYRGQPGYRPEMDGDSDGVGDGIACEPYRQRR